MSDAVEGGDGGKKTTSLPYLRRAYRIYVEPCCALLWEDVRLPPVPPVRAIIQASPAVSWSRAAVRYCWGAPLPPFPAISWSNPVFPWSNPAFSCIKTRLLLVKPFNAFPFLLSLFTCHPTHLTPLSFLLFSFSLSPLFPFPCFTLSPFTSPFPFSFPLFSFPFLPLSFRLFPFSVCLLHLTIPYLLFPLLLSPLCLSPFPLSVFPLSPISYKLPHFTFLTILLSPFPLPLLLYPYMQ